MKSQNNLLKIENTQYSDKQRLIDDIGSRAYMLLREEAMDNNLNLTEVMAEHILGLTLIIKTVEGTEKTQQLLAQIRTKLNVKH